MTRRHALDMKVLGVVPARAGSKSLHRKNVAPLLGKPLFHYTIEAALSAGLDEVILSTDIHELLTASLPTRVRAVRRPERTAGDDAPMSLVLRHIVDEVIEEDALIVLLQPTSPLRTADHIKCALTRYRRGDATMVMTVTAVDNSVLKCGFVDDGLFRAVRRTEDLFSNRQALPQLYKPNGAVYVFSAEAFRTCGQLPASAIAVVEMSPEDSLDIDTEADLRDCAQRLRAQGRSL